jgi:hypothetical protein
MKVSEPREEGIVPVRQLYPRLSEVSLVREERAEGRGPRKRFAFKPREVNFVAKPISGGIVPERRFPPNSNFCIAVKEQREEGKDPERRFEYMDMDPREESRES